MSFVLSAIISGHSKDVRCVYPLGDHLVTGSRDGSAKLWTQKQSGESVVQQWEVVTKFVGHKGFVSSICSREPDEEYKHGLIYTGCQDGIIRAFDPYKTDPVMVLEGHSANVVSLFLSRAKTLLSGSWDHLAKVWLNDREVMNLDGHTLGVWAVAVLPETGIMVTGSADKTIRLWKAGKCRKVLEHHTQSVRDLAVISSTEFLSCANDHLILMFKIKSEDSLDCEVVFRYEDVDYLYSLSIRNPATGWIASGEHIGLRVFDNGEVSNFLSVPTSSVWSTCVLPNGDLVAGCSDSKVYIFTQHQSRAAPDDIQAVFHAEIERFTHSLTNGKKTSESTLPAEIGGVKVDDIPGPDALKFPGKRDAQTKMIREGNNVSVHSWSNATGEWTKVGDIITDPDKSGQTSSGKVVYEGKEYDHVFNIDVDDNVVLKLPFNNDQDPYHVAQQFIFKHDLPQSYLDEIANFIFKNAGVTQGAIVGQAVDPFTGSGAYVSGSGGVPTAKDFSAGVAVDPFTGSGAYVSGSGGVPTASDIKNSGMAQTGMALDPFTGSGAYVSESASQSTSQTAIENSYFPLRTPLSFSQQPKLDALKGKLLEFNQKVFDQSKISDQDVIRLLELHVTERAVLADILLLLKILRWPAEFVFPCLDLTRLAILNVSTCKALTSNDETATDFVENIVIHLKNQAFPVNQMLALKVLSNVFASSIGCALMEKIRGIIFQDIGSFFPTENKNVQVGVATLLLNYSVMACNNNDDEGQGQCINMACILMEGITDPESKFRVLVAIGTLLSSSGGVRQAAVELDLGSRVRTWKELGETPKIANCAEFILKL